MSEFLFLMRFQKRGSGTGVFCEFCEIFKNTFFIEHIRWRLWKSQKTPQSFYYSNNINLVFVASIFSYSGRIPLRGKCPKMEFFLVRMKENTDQKKLHILTLFTQCTLSTKENKNFLSGLSTKENKEFLSGLYFSVYRLIY